MGRVNYILRALQLTPGKHEVALDFHPASVKTTETVAYVAGGLLLLLIVAGGVMAVRRKEQV
jgi:LPXTG-motif cell wall-anchored protein